MQYPCSLTIAARQAFVLPGKVVGFFLPAKALQVPERITMIALLLNNGQMAVSLIFLTSGCPYQ